MLRNLWRAGFRTRLFYWSPAAGFIACANTLDPLVILFVMYTPGSKGVLSHWRDSNMIVSMEDGLSGGGYLADGLLFHFYFQHRHGSH